MKVGKTYNVPFKAQWDGVQKVSAHKLVAILEADSKLVDSSYITKYEETAHLLDERIDIYNALLYVLEDPATKRRVTIPVNFIDLDAVVQTNISEITVKFTTYSDDEREALLSVLNNTGFSYVI